MAIQHTDDLFSVFGSQLSKLKVRLQQVWLSTRFMARLCASSFISAQRSKRHDLRRALLRRLAARRGGRGSGCVVVVVVVAAAAVVVNAWPHQTTTRRLLLLLLCA